MASQIEIRVKQTSYADWTPIGLLDLSDDTTINTIFQLVDIREPDKRSTDYVKTFTLPGTKRNNQVFQHIFENGFQSYAYNPNKKMDCQIVVNGNQYFTGYLQVNAINKVDNTHILSYEVTVYAKLGSFFNDISDAQLSDLVDLTEFNHAYTGGNIMGSWASKPPINIPPWWTPAQKAAVKGFIYRNGVQFPFQLGFGYVYPMIYSGQTDPTYWNTTDFKPAIYVKTLFDKILGSQGIQYKSKFLNSNYFKSLIIPGESQLDSTSGTMERSKEEKDNAEVWARFTDATESTLLITVPSFTNRKYENIIVKFPNDNITPSKDGSNQYNPATGEITVAKNGKYNLSTRLLLTLAFTLDGWLDSDTDPVGLTLQGQKNIPVKVAIVDVIANKIVASTSYDILTDAYFEGAPSATTIFLNKEVATSWSGINLSAGSRYRVEVAFEFRKSKDDYMTYDPATFGKPDRNVKCKLYVKAKEFTGVYNPKEGSKFLMGLVDNKLVDGDTVSMNNFIPDIKAIELIQELNKMFNLYWLLQEDGSFLIEPRDTFYESNGGNIKDWTYKLDENEAIKIEPMYDLNDKIYSYTYETDDTYENKDYTDTYKVNYGSKKVEVQSDFIDQENKTELLFSASPTVEYLSTGKYMTSFTRVENGVRQYQKPGVRILFYGGLLDCADTWYIKNQFTNQTTSVNGKKYPYAGHLDNPLAPNHDLNWGVSKKYYFYWTNLTTNTLFNEFWANYLAEITDPNSHLLTCKMILTDTDIINFDIRDIIQVNNVYYRVNKLTHNPLNFNSEVELFRVKDSFSFKAGSNLMTDIHFSFPVLPDPIVPDNTTPPKPIPWGGGVRPWRTDWVDVFTPVSWGTYDTFENIGIWGAASTKNYPYSYAGTLTGNTTFTSVKSGVYSSWADVTPVNTWYDTKNNDVANNNNFSTQQAQFVSGRNNVVAASARSVNIMGDNNIVQSDALNINLQGNNNIVRSGISNVSIIGDNQVVTESNTTIINGVVIADGGVRSNFSMLRSPSDSVGHKSCVISGGKNSVDANTVYYGGQDSTNS